MRSTPAVSPREALSSACALSARASISWARRASCTPASVSATPRPAFCSSETLVSRSSWASCWDTAEGDIDWALATADMVPDLCSCASRNNRCRLSTAAPPLPRTLISSASRYRSERFAGPDDGRGAQWRGEHANRLPHQHLRAGHADGAGDVHPRLVRSAEHTSELKSRGHLVCRLPLAK